MRLTESEVAAIIPLLFAAAVIIVAWLADLAGLRIAPAAILGFVLLSTVFAGVALVRRDGAWLLSYSRARLAAFFVIVFGVAGYILWLASPSLFPITQGPDIVHHLSLIHFIQRRHALPHDPALGAYLGEMATYTLAATCSRRSSRTRLPLTPSASFIRCKRAPWRSRRGSSSTRSHGLA